MTDVLIVETWPAVPGHGGETRTLRAKRKAVSEDGRYWLVRQRGIFRRWRWRPVRGMFVRLHAVSAPSDAGSTDA